MFRRLLRASLPSNLGATVVTNSSITDAPRGAPKTVHCGCRGTSAQQHIGNFQAFRTEVVRTNVFPEVLVLVVVVAAPAGVRAVVQAGAAVPVPPIRVRHVTRYLTEAAQRLGTRGDVPRVGSQEERVAGLLPG